MKPVSVVFTVQNLSSCDLTDFCGINKRTKKSFRFKHPKHYQYAIKKFSFPVILKN